jgi:2'-5' RNA ligase
LWKAIAPLRERSQPLPVKWVAAENLHLSLKFLGDVEDAQEPALRSALQNVAKHSGRPIVLQVSGFGVFPDYRSPHVLWAGVTADPALELLQHTVEQTFAPLGFPTEARPFRPHVTIGRAARSARPRDFAELEGMFDRLHFDATTTVAELDLMQSTTQPGGTGPVYQVRHRERLS